MVNWKRAWETWDLRAVILLSLLLQIFLIFSAPLRKRMSKACITMPMWLAYLLADMIPIYAVGLISKSHLTGDKSGPFAYPDLLAFWAPFLLVHLGGTDTITAFALEDNELWLRHFLNLVVQSWYVLYAFVQSLYTKKDVLLVPTVLIFIAGLIKYGERTYSLYLASTSRFIESLLKDPDPGLNYAEVMDEYSSNKEARIPTKIEMTAPPKRVNYTEKKTETKQLTDLQVVQEAYRFFETFKGLIADLIFTFHERNQSREFFLQRSPRQAFKVVEVELNFLYEILYTKVLVVQSLWGHILRLTSFSLNWAALVLFYLVDKEKERFENFDVGITYTLLLGAIALDIVAFLMVLCSDWIIVARTKSELPSWFNKMLQKFVRVDRNRWPENSGMIMRILHRRWSESISQYNLIDYCLRPRSKWWRITISLFGLTNMLDGLKYVKTVEFTDGLRDFIFEELKTKSEMADDLDTAKEIISARGDWVVRFEGCNELSPWINGFDFVQSLLLWHIATELCIVDDDIKMETYTQRCCAKNTKGGVAKNAEGNNDKDYCFWSKQMSDYMLYLLIMQTTLLSTVARIGQISFRDTCAEAKKFFCERKVGNLEDENICCPNACCCFGICKCNCKGDEGQEGYHISACKRILEVNTVVEPAAVKGDGSKSVLFDACRLAKELKKLGKDRKWVIISKVWVELMAYAACHCRAYTHAAQLSKGGQLITLVWLLMAQLGLGDQFQISEGHARAKLIVGK